MIGKVFFSVAIPNAASGRILRTTRLGGLWSFSVEEISQDMGGVHRICMLVVILLDHWSRIHDACMLVLDNCIDPYQISTPLKEMDS